MAQLDIKIETRKDYFASYVVGYVGADEVIAINNSVFSEWRVGSSRCLPGDIKHAAAYMECMRMAHAKARELGAP